MRPIDDLEDEAGQVREVEGFTTERGMTLLACEPVSRDRAFKQIAEHASS